MGKITKYLNQLIIGNVFDSSEILEAYSTDHSILKIKPKFVAFPESTDDIRKILRFFDKISKKDIPISIAPRGAGTGEGGSSLSNGLIISTERLNKMLEIDPRERLVRVQAGITLKELNTALSVSGLAIPISGHDNSTIGGLIATAPIDDSAGKYGGIQNFVRRLEVVLPSGEILQTNRLKRYYVAKKITEKTPESEIYHQIIRLLKDEERIVGDIGKNALHDKRGYPSIGKMSYRESIDLMPLFFGSEGTLGVISEVILRAVPLGSRPARVVATFKKLDQALELARKLEPIEPRNINIYDLRILEEVHKSGKNLNGIARKLEDGFVVFASFDEKRSISFKKVVAVQRSLPRNAKFIYESPKTVTTLNEIENAITTYLNAPKNSERIPVLTDFYLPIHCIGNFLTELADLEKKTGLELALYGSTATSIYHLRPKFRLDDENLSVKISALLKACSQIIDHQGGSLTGGTPEGRVKAIVTNADLDPEYKEVYEKIKHIFDPNHILNPDVKLGATSKFTLSHLRTGNLPKIML